MELFQILDSCNGLGPIVKVIAGLFAVVKIVVPILLLIMGAIDLAKAVLASDDKEIKAATSKLTKRAIAAAAVFFAVTIVDVIMGIVGDSNWRSCWTGAGGSEAPSGSTVVNDD
ncbi:MAG: hypothetical protein IKO78_06230 [Bacilli bacterium]|nr:hypothetical protein [Bacilli bacterium]